MDIYYGSQIIYQIYSTENEQSNWEMTARLNRHLKRFRNIGQIDGLENTGHRLINRSRVKQCQKNDFWQMICTRNVYWQMTYNLTDDYWKDRFTVKRQPPDLLIKRTHDRLQLPKNILNIDNVDDC